MNPSIYDLLDVKTPVIESNSAIVKNISQSLNTNIGYADIITKYTCTFITEHQKSCIFFNSCILNDVIIHFKSEVTPYNIHINYQHGVCKVYMCIEECFEKYKIHRTKYGDCIVTRVVVDITNENNPALFSWTCNYFSLYQNGASIIQ